MIVLNSLLQLCQDLDVLYLKSAIFPWAKHRRINQGPASNL